MIAIKAYRSVWSQVGVQRMRRIQIFDILRRSRAATSVAVIGKTDRKNRIKFCIRLVSRAICEKRRGKAILKAKNMRFFLYFRFHCLIIFFSVSDQSAGIYKFCRIVKSKKIAIRFHDRQLFIDSLSSAIPYRKQKILKFVLACNVYNFFSYLLRKLMVRVNVCTKRCTFPSVVFTIFSHFMRQQVVKQVHVYEDVCIFVNPRQTISSVNASKALHFSVVGIFTEEFDWAFFFPSRYCGIFLVSLVAKLSASVITGRP